MGAIVSKEIAAENQFTDAIFPDFRDVEAAGKLNISITGTFNATVSLQRKLPDYPHANAWGASEWATVDTFTTAEETLVSEFEAGTQYRIGVETGNFTFGTVRVRLSR